MGIAKSCQNQLKKTKTKPNQKTKTETENNKNSKKKQKSKKKGASLIANSVQVVKSTKSVHHFFVKGNM